MPGWTARLGSVFAGVSLFSIGYGLLMSLVSLRLVREGYSDSVIGLVSAAFYAGGAAGALRAAAVVGRVGHIRAFTAFAALLATVTLAHTLTSSAWAWTLLRAASGFFFYGLLMVAESWLNEKTSDRIRAQVIAVYMVLHFLSLSAGQALLNVSDLGGPLPFILSAMLVTVSLVPVALFRTSEPEAIATSRLRLGRLYGISPLALGGSFGAGILMGSYYSLAPAFAERAGLPVAQVSAFVGAGILGGLVCQWPLGWASDRIGRGRAVLLAALLVAAGSAPPLLWEGLPPVGYLATAFLCGAGLFAVYPLSLAAANDYIRANDVVEVSRSLLFIMGLGAVLGPFSGGAAMQWLGPAGFFAQFAAVAVLLAALAVPAPSLPRKLRSVFVVMPQTSAAGARLDPRRREHWTTEQRRSRHDTRRRREGERQPR